MFYLQTNTENTHLINEQIITLASITNVRATEPSGNIEAFCFFLMNWYRVLQVEKFGLSVKRQAS
jgi:hypothetical protein